MANETEDAGMCLHMTCAGNSKGCCECLKKEH